MTKEQQISGASVTRFADIEILRYQVDGFEQLPLERKLLVYHLSEAALWGRDIIFDQNGRYSLRLRYLFETLYLHYEGDRESKLWQGIETYLFRLWFASGIHHHYGSEKFEPDFTESQLLALVQEVQRETGMLLEFDSQALSELCRAIFSPDYYTQRTMQSGAEDLVGASSVNFYDEGISTQEVEAYYHQRASENEQADEPLSLGLNARLARGGDGRLYEQTYQVKGLYGEALEQISAHLKSALAYVETPAQRQTLLDLISYYKTGNLADFNRYCINWVRDTAVHTDFINGFTEVYADPLGMKGSWEGLVHIRNEKASERTSKICREAAWFEEHAPIDPRFKKTNPTGVTATVVTVAMLSGDSYPATPIGINLPNADWIRARHGSKSVTIDNIHHAYRVASSHSGMDELFVPDPAVRELLQRYDGLTDELHTDLHECLGHGSGQLLPGVSPEALGAYHSTIEEARADLFALYYMADPKLVELGLLPDSEAYKACYYRYLLNGLVTQLVRIRQGYQIEEAHMRNRALIARYVLEQAGSQAVELRGLELVIYDYSLLRSSIATLLGEIQRIKSEGDQTAARELVERYAIEVDPEMHSEILQRYATLQIAPYRGFVNPKMTIVYDQDGIADVALDYTEGYAEQMLRYSRDYACLPLDPVGRQALVDPHPSEETLEQAKALRGSLRHAMDGMVASSMRQKGLFYAYNFGLTQEYISRLASKQPQSMDLANYILSRDVRELKLIGQLIYPVESVSFEVATTLSRACFANPELRDCLCKNLFDRCPSAKGWALAWLFAPEWQSWEDIHSIAYITLARKITKGEEIECESWRRMLLERALETLDNHETPYITPTQAGAILLLKRWGRQREDVRRQILTSPIFKSWQTDPSMVHQEFANDLSFEFELV